MDLTQTQPEESSSPSAETISQKPPKNPYCDTCCLGRSGPPGPDEPGHDHREIVELEDLEASGQDCQACAGTFEFLSGQIKMNERLLFLWANSATTSQFHIDNISKRCEFFTKNAGSNHEGITGVFEPAPLPDYYMIWRMNAPSGDTSSTEAFTRLKSWISRCETEHTLCRPAKNRPLPRRVLKIEGIQPLRVRLVEDCPQRENYACLSHRWGPQTEKNSLKRHNLHLYKTGVPEENLYPLVKDAIEAAFRLDLRFIWIDCYCIIQDDMKDWEMAAAQMASIYEDAFLTISATESEGGSSMFSTIGEPYAGTQVTEVKGEPVFLRNQLRHPCEIKRSKRVFLEGPLLKRGWVFQERLLSNRVIHFMQDEMFWECRESTWCECTSRGEDWKTLREKTPRTIQNESWEDIATEYLKTDLTFDKDRVPALAGIARRYGESHGLTYLAGIWKEQLPGALMWRAGTMYDPPRPLEQIAPSWSWLSVPSIYRFGSQCSPGSIRFLGCSTPSQDADIYAGATHAEITVEGPVLDFKIYHHTDGWNHVVGRSGNGFLSLEADFDFDPEEPTKHRSVPQGSTCTLLIIDNRDAKRPDDQIQGILLRQTGSTEERGVTKYERVGYFPGYESSHYVDELGEFADYCGGSLRFPDPEGKRGPPRWLLERAETRKITII